MIRKYLEGSVIDTIDTIYYKDNLLDLASILKENLWLIDPYNRNDKDLATVSKDGQVLYYINKDLELDLKLNYPEIFKPEGLRFEGLRPNAPALNLLIDNYLLFASGQDSENRDVQNKKLTIENGNLIITDMLSGENLTIGKYENYKDLFKDRITYLAQRPTATGVDGSSAESYLKAFGTHDEEYYTRKMNEASNPITRTWYESMRDLERHKEPFIAFSMAPLGAALGTAGAAAWAARSLAPLTSLGKAVLGGTATYLALDDASQQITGKPLNENIASILPITPFLGDFLVPGGPRKPKFNIKKAVNEAANIVKKWTNSVGRSMFPRVLVVTTSGLKVNVPFGSLDFKWPNFMLMLSKKAKTLYDLAANKHYPLFDTFNKEIYKYLDNLPDTKENNVFILAILKWMDNDGAISNASDAYWAKEVFDYARSRGVDVFKYKSIEDLIRDPKMVIKPREYPYFNPDKSPFIYDRTITNNLGHTLDIYKVPETPEALEAVCAATAYTFKDLGAPWCLAKYTITGKATESSKRMFFDTYKGIPKEIAFIRGEGGKKTPIAFNASRGQGHESGYINIGNKQIIASKPGEKWQIENLTKEQIEHLKNLESTNKIKNLIIRLESGGNDVAEFDIIEEKLIQGNHRVEWTTLANNGITYSHLNNLPDKPSISMGIEGVNTRTYKDPVQYENLKQRFKMSRENLIADEKKYKDLMLQVSKRQEFLKSKGLSNLDNILLKLMDNDESSIISLKHNIKLQKKFKLALIDLVLDNLPLDKWNDFAAIELMYKRTIKEAEEAIVEKGIEKSKYVPYISRKVRNISISDTQRNIINDILTPYENFLNMHPGGGGIWYRYLMPESYTKLNNWTNKKLFNYLENFLFETDKNRVEDIVTKLHNKIYKKIN